MRANRIPGQQLTVVPAAKAARLVAALATTTVVPAIVADAGDAAAKRFLEFFAVTDVGGDMQRLDFVQGAKLVMLAPVEEFGRPHADRGPGVLVADGCRQRSMTI